MLIEVVVKHIVIALVAIDRGGALRSNGSKLANDMVLIVLAVVHRMVIATSTVKVLASATQVPARHT